MAWRDRSIAYRAQGDAEKATADAAEAERLNPRLVADHAEKGLWAQAGGYDAEAVAEFDKAI